MISVHKNVYKRALVKPSDRFFISDHAYSLGIRVAQRIPNVRHQAMLALDNDLNYRYRRFYSRRK